MDTQSALIPRFWRFLSDNRQRGISIAFVEFAALTAILSYTLFLPDEVLVLVLSILAYNGLISAFVASNNTAKIYAAITNLGASNRLPCLTLRLFIFEQGMATIVAIIIIFYWLESLAQINPLFLISLAVFSSSAAVTAYTRHQDTDFVRYNYIRGVTNFVRVIIVFWLVAFTHTDQIPALFVISAGFVYFVGLTMLGKGFRENRSTRSQENLPWSVPVLIREYILGLPAAGARSLITSGVMLAVIETLPESSARLFRFLLLPKDIFGRFFNAFLPLTFSRLFQTTFRFSTASILIAVFLPVSFGWYGIGVLISGAGWSDSIAYCFFFASSFLVYGLMPFVWRTIHRNQAVLSTAVVLAATIGAGGLYAAMPPTTIAGFLNVITIYYVIWIALMMTFLKLDDHNTAEASKMK